jgi:hypothetical protein
MRTEAEVEMLVTALDVSTGSNVQVTRFASTGCPFFDAHSVEEFPYTSRSPTPERVMAKAVTKKTARKSPAKKRTVKKSLPRKKAVKRAAKKRTPKKAAPKKAAKKRTVKKAPPKKTVKKAAKKRTSEKAALKKRAKKTTARIKKKITKAAQQAERDMEALAKLPVLEPNGQLAEAKERLKAERKRHAAKKKKQSRKRKAKKKK